SGGVWWLLRDDLGSVRDLVDNSGAAVNHITYDSYGNVIVQTHPEVKTRLLFAGRELDAETGLYYYRARNYDPRTGRFISQDTIARADGLDLFAYAGNDPVNYVDPTGHFSLGVPKLTIGDFELTWDPKTLFDPPKPTDDMDIQKNRDDPGALVPPNDQ